MKTRNSDKKQRRVKACRVCQQPVKQTVLGTPGYCIIAHAECCPELTRQLLEEVGLSDLSTYAVMYDTYGDPREVQSTLQNQAKRLTHDFQQSSDSNINDLVQKLAYLFDLSFLIGTKEGINLNRCFRSLESNTDTLIKKSLQVKFHLPVAA